MDRAIALYRTLFDWKIERFGEQPYWLIATGAAGTPGINGGLMPRRGPHPTDGQPVNAYPCTVEVDDIDAYLDKARQGGAEMGVPKMVIPGVGWLAYCHDTEGKIFGLMQPDKNAK